MSQSINDWILSFTVGFLDTFFPDLDYTLPVWLYTLNDFQWLLIFQVFFFLLVYIRVRSIAKRTRTLEELMGETCGNEKLIWMELMTKTAEITEAVRESGAETEEQLRLEIGDKVTDLAMRISKLRLDMHNGSTQ